MAITVFHSFDPNTHKQNKKSKVQKEKGMEREIKENKFNKGLKMSTGQVGYV